MGYRHNTGQNKTIANATSDALTRTHACDVRLRRDSSGRRHSSEMAV